MTQFRQQFTRNICGNNFSEYPNVSEMSLRILTPLHSNQSNHVTLTQASRPSTTSEKMENAFSGKTNKIDEE